MEIRKEELRIGNTVSNKKGEIYSIENGWQLDEGEELFPIPLTEENITLLIEGDVLIDNINYNNSIIEDKVYKENGEWFYVIDSYADEMGCIVYVERKVLYIHQVQNLRFNLKPTA
jgi:hypothetical protein